MTNAVLHKLEDAFLRGLSDRQACLFADIGESTLYKYQDEYPEYVERKKLLKENTKMKARLLLNRAIEGGDLDAGKWYLERKDEEFKAKQSVDMNASVKAEVKPMSPDDAAQALIDAQD